MKLKKIKFLSFKLKRNSVLVAVIVFLLLLSLIGVYFWWSVSVKTSADKQNFGPNYYKQIPDSKQKDETENWKTYTGLGVNFEYPPSWGVKEYKDNPGVDDSIILSGGDVQSKSGFKVNSIAIVLTKGNQSSINDPLFVGMCKSSGKDCVEKNIQLNGVTAIQRDYFATTPWGINKTERQRVTTITKNDLTVFIKQERFVENESTFLTPYERILSTFKFLDEKKQESTTGWKIYNSSLNVSYNGHTSYSFKYPSDWDLKQENPSNYKYLAFSTGGEKSGRLDIDALGHGGPGGAIKTIRQEIRDYPTGKVTISEIEAINEKTILGTYGFLADEKTGSRYFWFESNYPTNYSDNFSKKIDLILGSFKLL